MGMGEDISAVFPTDYRGRSLSEIPAMKGIKNYKDIALLVVFGAGSSPEWWVIYAGTKYDQTIAVGCTAVSAVGYYPFLDTKQIIGLMGGMKGAAEYEQLVRKPGLGVAGMVAQSTVHIMVVIFIGFANVVFFLEKRRRR